MYRCGWGWCAALVALIFLGACEDDKEPVGDAGGSPDMVVGDMSDPDLVADGDQGEEEVVEGDAGDAGDMPQVMCEPNEIVRCIFENTPEIEQCNFRGTATVNARCAGTAVCREGACVEVECIPGTRACLSEDQPAQCKVDGSGYEPGARCEEGVTCAAGSCQDLCTLAAGLSSYIGCEYWPVELENSLLYDEDETSTPEAPFAVVLSNPQREPARVTVYTPEGEVLEAVTEVYIRWG